MKKVFPIMTGKSKAGAAVFCCMLMLPLSTGIAFASGIKSIPNNAQAAQSTVNVSVSPKEQAELDRQRKEAKQRNYSEYTSFGMIYNMEQDLFLYDGKAIRYFYDDIAVKGFTSDYTSFNYTDYNKSVDLTAVRDTNGKLTALSPSSKEKFDQRTAKIAESIKRLERYANKNVAASESFHTGSSAANNSANETEAIQSNSNISEGNRRMDYAESYDPNYVDDTFKDYVNYGVSYDKVTKEWMFNQKVIALFIDTGHLTYVNLPANDTICDYTKTVKASDRVFLKAIRKSDSSIDSIAEMTIEEAIKTLNTLFIS